MNSKRNTGMKRNNNEQYYTKDQLARDLVTRVSELYNLTNYDIILEPSAGTGAFLKPLEELKVGQILAYDIEPKYANVIKQDFLITVFDTTKKHIVIGNPPFGRQASLAKKFIKHCCGFAEVICFILPRSFKKPSMSNCFANTYHKVHEQDLDEKSFVFDNKEYSVQCVFQIWERRDYKRDEREKSIPNEWYEIVKKMDMPNIAFRRVGVYAGKFTFDKLESLSSESHYFINCKIPVNDEVKEMLSNLRWDTNNTTGPKSISKQELIIALNGLKI